MKQQVAPGQWITHHEVAEFVPTRGVLLEKEVAVAGLGDKGVSEIGCVSEGTSERGAWAGWNLSFSMNPRSDGWVCLRKRQRKERSVMMRWKRGEAVEARTSAAGVGKPRKISRISSTRCGVGWAMAPANVVGGRGLAARALGGVERAAAEAVVFCLHHLHRLP